jgi:hypothetical protein
MAPKKGTIPWNKGLKGFGSWPKTIKGSHLSEEHKEKIRLHAKRGKDNYIWKGDMAGKVSKHMWLNRNFGKEKSCEICKTKDTNKTYDWANKDHKYSRIRTDYMRICRSCHRKYDYKNNGYKTK